MARLYDKQRFRPLSYHRQKDPATDVMVHILV
jgi:hypothetical protein